MLLRDGYLLIAIHGGDGVLHADEFLGLPASIDATLFQPEEMARYVRQAGFGIASVATRPPYEIHIGLRVIHRGHLVQLLTHRFREQADPPRRRQSYPARSRMIANLLRSILHNVGVVIVGHMASRTAAGVEKSGERPCSEIRSCGANGGEERPSVVDDVFEANLFSP